MPFPRSVQTILAGVQRRTNGIVSPQEILDALTDANLEVHTRFDWPWTYADANILVQPTYTTGTLSINNGSASFTGSGTAWQTSWLYRKLFLGTNNIDYFISSFSSTTAGTLKQPINIVSDLTNVGYTIFQDTYPLPSDCEPGNILIIVNPIYRYRLRYLPRYTMEWQNVFLRSFNNFQTGFVDAGYDDTQKQYLLRFGPPPGSVAEYRIVYRRHPPDLTSLTQTTLLPDSFDRILELLTTYYVKTQHPTPIPGWQEDKTEAYQLIQSMRRRMVTATLDIYSSYWTFPYFEQSSVYGGGGALIGGPTVGSYP